MPDWLVILISAGVSSSAGWLTAWLARRNQVEGRIDIMENQNRALWLYTRELIDHIYKQLPPPPPEPPAAVVDMERRTK